jgi:hypothetical protein
VGHRALDGRNVDGTFSSFSVALPFGTGDKAISDLRETILDHSSGQLIFASPVRIDGDVIDYGRGPVRLGRVILAETKRDQSRSGRDHSLWTVRFAPALGNGDRMYLRFRCAVANPGQAWIWKRSLFAKDGALIDIRVSELRETVTVPDWMAFQDDIIPINKLNCFVIAPAFLQARAMSPQPQYIRLLEGRVWERYLGRPAEWFSRRRLIIYHWRVAKEDQTVSPTNPFRAFLDLSREFGHVRFGHHVRSAVVLLVALALAMYGILPVWSAAKGAVFDFVSSQRRNLSIVGILIPAAYILWNLFKQRRPVVDFVHFLRSLGLRLEDGLFRIRRR